MRCTALLGMSTAAWMRLRATRLRIADLTLTQAVDEPLWPQRRPSPVSSADPLIHVVACHGRLVVEDGHHRVARARAAGHTHIDGRVLHVARDAATCQPCPTEGPTP